MKTFGEVEANEKGKYVVRSIRILAEVKPKAECYCNWITYIVYLSSWWGEFVSGRQFRFSKWEQIHYGKG